MHATCVEFKLQSVWDCFVQSPHSNIGSSRDPSFGLVKCTAGRVCLPVQQCILDWYTPSKVYWVRSRINYFASCYCASAARRKSPHAQVSPRVIGQAVLRSELRCAAASHWSRHGQSMERGVKLHDKETASYYYRWLDYSGYHYSFTNNQWKQSLDLRTSINSCNGIRDTNRAGICCTIAINVATFSIYIRFGESPFPDGISFVGHFCQRLTPIYNIFIRNTSSTVIQRTMVYYFSGRCSWAAS